MIIHNLLDLTQRVCKYFTLEIVPLVVVRSEQYQTVLVIARGARVTLRPAGVYLHTAISIKMNLALEIRKNA